MKWLLSILLTLVTVLSFGQTPPTTKTLFNGTLNVFASSGTPPSFNIVGLYNHSTTLYASSDVQLGDVVWAMNGDICVPFEITNINSSLGGNIDADVIAISDTPYTDPFPNGVTAIMRLTVNNDYPLTIDGISGDMQSCIQTHLAILLDQTIASSANRGVCLDTVRQVANGLSLDPAYDGLVVTTDTVQGNGIAYYPSKGNIFGDSLPDGIIVELIGPDTIVVQKCGNYIATNPTVEVGRHYFIQSDGTVYDTIEQISGFNIISRAFYTGGEEVPGQITIWINNEHHVIELAADSTSIEEVALSNGPLVGVATADWGVDTSGGGSIAYYRDGDGNWSLYSIVSSGGTGTFLDTVTHVGHNYTLQPDCDCIPVGLDTVSTDAVPYFIAYATEAGDSLSIGVITEIIDANTYVVQMGGHRTVSGTLVKGRQYWLQPDSTIADTVPLVGSTYVYSRVLQTNGNDANTYLVVNELHPLVGPGSGSGDTNMAISNLTADANRSHIWTSFDYNISTAGHANTLSWDGATGNVGIHSSAATAAAEYALTVTGKMYLNDGLASVYIGDEAGRLSSGTSNVAIGHQSMQLNTTGSANTAVGRNSLDQVTIGGTNSALGFDALGTLTTGNDNTAVGNSAGIINSTGSQNTNIGSAAHPNDAAAINRTSLGYGSTNDADNQVRLGDGNVSELWVDNYRWNVGQVLGVGQDNYVMTYDNGTGQLSLEVAGAATDFNFAEDDLTATGTRLHTFASNDLVISTTGSANALTWDGLTGNVGINTTPAAAATGAELTVTGSIDLNDGNNSTYVGEDAGGSASGADNVAIGFQAGLSFTTGFNNVAVGREAMENHLTSAQNVAVGYQALRTASGNNNVAIGAFALDAHTGTQAIAIGTNALGSNTSAGGNVAIGHNAADANTIATGIVAIGRDALGANVDGTDNIAIGVSALGANISGDNNIGIGTSALAVNTGNDNIAFGSFSLDANTTGFDNLAIGGTSLTNNTTGSGNTAIGNLSMRDNIDGSNNTAIGSSCMLNIEDGTHNVAIGRSASQNMVNADSTVAIGSHALVVNLADGNTAIGGYAGNNNVNGVRLTAIGKEAAKSSLGDDNTAIGYEAIKSANSIDSVTAVGSRSLFNLTTGKYNTAVGAHTSLGITTQENTTAIGFGANPTASNQIMLGNSSVTELVAGNYAFDIDQTVGVGQDNFVLTYDNGTGQISLEAAGGVDTNMAENDLTATGARTHTFAANDLTFSTTGSANALTFDGTTGHVGINTSAATAALEYELTVTGRIHVTDGNNSIYVGKDAGPSGSGAQNTALGNEALESVTTGALNTAIGHRAGQSITTNFNNTIVGKNAYRLGNGQQVVVMGADAASNSTATGIVAIGYLSQNLATSATGNVSLGRSTLQANLTGNQNTAIGENVLSVNTAANNAGLGYNSLQDNTSGIQNAALGAFALSNNIDGNDNSALGYSALVNNQSGSGNSAVGRNALGSNVAGDRNLAFGFQAMFNNVNASDNTAIGASSLIGLKHGSFNIAVGAGSAANIDTVDNVTVVGGNAYVGTISYDNVSVFGAEAEPDQDNQVVLGDTLVTQLMAGKFYRWNLDQSLGSAQDHWGMAYNNTSGEIELDEPDYGYMSFTDSSVIVVATGGSTYDIITNPTNNLFSNTIQSGDFTVGGDSIVINCTCAVEVDVNISFSAGNSSDYAIKIIKNGTPIGNAGAERGMTGNNVGNAGFHEIFSASDGDVIKIGTLELAGTTDPTFVTGDISIKKL